MLFALLSIFRGQASCASNPGGTGFPTDSPRELDGSTGGYLQNSGTAFQAISGNDWGDYSHSSYTFDEKGDIDMVSSTNGITAEYDVNDFGEVTSENVFSTNLNAPNRLNYSATYDYWSNGNLYHSYLPSGTVTYNYTNRYMVKSINDSGRGLFTSYNYDRNDNVLSINSFHNSIWKSSVNFDYYSNRDLVEYVRVGTAPGRHAFGYDKNGNMTASTNPYGHTTNYEYDGYDRLRRVTGPLGNQTVLERLQMGQQMIVRSLDDQESELRRSEKVMDPLGRTQSYKIVGADGLEESYTYVYEDVDENKQITVTDSLGRSWVVIKDKKGQVLEESGPGGKTNYEYAYKNNTAQIERIIKTETEEVPEGGNKSYDTEYEFNEQNKIAVITENPGEGEEEFITSYEYDNEGHLTGVVDAEGNTVTHVYEKGRRIKTKKLFKNSPLSITTSFTYYADDQLESITDDKGNTTTYEYDDQKRLEKITYPDDTFIQYAYSEVSGCRSPIIHPGESGDNLT